MKVSVECRAVGAEVEPCRFYMGARKIEADCVIDRWPGSDHCYVKLRGDDGDTYILRRDALGCWQLVLFEVADLHRRRLFDARQAVPGRRRSPAGHRVSGPFS